MSLSLFMKTCVQRINDDLIFMRASSLTYQTFLAIVPLLAVMFGIAKGFGIDASLESFLRAELSEHTEVLNYLLEFSRTTLQEAKGGVVAGTGIVVLLFTAMRLFSSVEETFNTMWGIRTPRRYVHKAISYLALIVLAPLLFVIAGSVTIFISTHLIKLSEGALFSRFSEFMTVGISLIPLITLTTVFSSFFYIIPSAQISIRSALFSGIAAACAFQMLQVWYIQLQLSLTKISTIYGSFVALPLFLAWLWMSWTLFLLAGELSVIFEERFWHFSEESAKVDKKACTLAILLIVIQKYQAGTPISLKEFIKTLRIPLKLLYSIIEDLKERGLVYESMNGTLQTGTLIPSVDAFSYTMNDLLFTNPERTASVEEWLASMAASSDLSPEIRKAYEILSHVAKAVSSSPYNISSKTVV